MYINICSPCHLSPRESELPSPVRRPRGRSSQRPRLGSRAPAASSSTRERRSRGFEHVPPPAPPPFFNQLAFFLQVGWSQRSLRFCFASASPLVVWLGGLEVAGLVFGKDQKDLTDPSHRLRSRDAALSPSRAHRAEAAGGLGPFCFLRCPGYFVCALYMCVCVWVYFSV